MKRQVNFTADSELYDKLCHLSIDLHIPLRELMEEAIQDLLEKRGETWKA